MSIRMLFMPLFAVCFASSVQAASILTFVSVEANDTSSWSFSCTDCNMLAFQDNDGQAYDTNNNFSLDGTLGEIGSAFTPTGQGPKKERNPDLSAGGEEAFLVAVATVLGDSVISGSYEKTEDTSDPNSGPGTPTTGGDYFLWKASNYAGIAKILSVGVGNVFTLTGSKDLSHIAHISTRTSQLEPMPLPAGFVFLLSGAGLFAFMRRRSRS